VRKDYTHTVGLGYTNALRQANINAIAFRRLYGEDAARVLLRRTDNSEVKHVSVVMKQIPGDSLDYLLKNGDIDAINNALEAYKSSSAAYDMLESLKINGVLHNDVNLGNILFDAKTGKFNLIDFDSASLNPEGVPLSESQYRSMLSKLNHDFSDLERRAQSLQ